MSDMINSFNVAVEVGDYTMVKSFALPARGERRAPIPANYLSGATGRWLNSAYHGDVWSHQAEALQLFDVGHNVVISTGTASGKSLVFQAAALRILEENKDAVILVFYPLKALVADQLISWRTALSAAGFADNTVARLDGDVREGREKLIQTARVIVATPDVTHAWLMSNLAKPVHKNFFARLRMVVIDEAHVFDSVFGSNFAYLFRRLAVAARLGNRGRDFIQIRVIAASATISNPSEHLRALTGLDFAAVDESSDGSPQYERKLLHIAAKAGAEASLAADLQRKLLSTSDMGSFITFVKLSSGRRAACDQNRKRRSRTTIPKRLRR